MTTKITNAEGINIAEGLKKLIKDYLEAESLDHYKISELQKGNQKYIEVDISIKIA